MLVTQYIKQLLQSHDCVVVPQFGAFIASYQSAVYQPVHQVFMAPRKQLAFNQSVQKDDGLLLQELKLGASLSTEEANAFIQEFSQNVFTQIHEKHIAKVDGIGVFSLNDEGNLVFSPAVVDNFLADSFGLKDLDIISNLQPIEVVPQLKVVAKEEPVSVVPSETTIEIKPKSKTLKYMVWSAAASVILTSSILLKKNDTYSQMASYIQHFFKTEQVEVKTSPIKTEFVQEVVPQEQTVTPEVTAPVTKEEKVAEVVQNKVVETVTSPTIELEAGRSYIIAGVFSKESNAKKLASNFSEGKIIKNEKGLYTVIAKSFESKEAAKLELVAMQDQFGKDLWVLNK